MNFIFDLGGYSQASAVIIRNYAKLSRFEPAKDDPNFDLDFQSFTITVQPPVILSSIRIKKNNSHK